MIPDEAAMQARAEQLIEELMERVPLWEMECNKSPGAARVSYSAMSGAIL
jgi:hypothetical protein